MSGGLLLVFAHPDDESMGVGGTVFRHTAAGIEVHLVCATRGGAGWQGRPPGATPDQLPAIRAAELERASAVLGLASVDLWDYPDGGVPAGDPVEITARISAAARRLQPEAVIGWGPDGGYGHTDHIAVGACTDAALAGGDVPLYHFVIDEDAAQRQRTAFSSAGLGSGLPTIAQPWVSVVVELSEAELEAKRRAVLCHQSQLGPPMDRIIADPGLLGVFARESFIRVGAGRTREPLRLAGDLLPQFG